MGAWLDPKKPSDRNRGFAIGLRSMKLKPMASQQATTLTAAEKKRLWTIDMIMSDFQHLDPQISFSAYFPFYESTHSGYQKFRLRPSVEGVVVRAFTARR
jgi:hypothetical protein